jgi:serine/threonine protein kinase
MPLGPAARLGPYEIVAAIGAGGMGEVYRARDTRLDFRATAGANARAQYAVARDGRFLVITVTDETPALPITIVENWIETLPKP